MVLSDGADRTRHMPASFVARATQQMINGLAQQRIHASAQPNQSRSVRSLDGRLEERTFIDMATISQYAGHGAASFRHGLGRRAPK